MDTEIQTGFDKVNETRNLIITFRLTHSLSSHSLSYTYLPGPDRRQTTRFNYTMQYTSKVQTDRLSMRCNEKHHLSTDLLPFFFFFESLAFLDFCYSKPLPLG
jgi:hypothetical protein